jgi:hypothetical protein
VAEVVAWLLLIASLVLIALNPGVPSLRYAILWLGVMAAARGASALAPSLAPAIDLSLLFVAFFGLEIGGLFLLPAILSFLVADLLKPGLTGRKTP